MDGQPVVVSAYEARVEWTVLAEQPTLVVAVEVRERRRAARRGAVARHRQLGALKAAAGRVTVQTKLLHEARAV